MRNENKIVRKALENKNRTSNLLNLKYFLILSFEF